MKMYIIINDKLKDKGLIAAQCSHAVLDYMDNKIKECCNPAFGYSVCEDINELRIMLDYFRYNGNGMIVLKAPEEILIQLQNQGYTTVVDRLMDNMVVAVNLGMCDEVPEVTKGLKLV